MSYFANVNDEGFVDTVIVAESAEWCENALGGVWLQTSYNTYGGVHYTTDKEGNRVPSDDQSKALRKNYAGIGFTYDEDRDAFIPPKPFESWVLDEDTCLWEAPVPYPTDGNQYVWDEETQEWAAVENETE